MKRTTHRPAAITAVDMEKLIAENHKFKPQLLLMFEQAALMHREKHQAYIRAGFTDAQAFEMIK